MSYHLMKSVSMEPPRRFSVISTDDVTANDCSTRRSSADNGSSPSESLLNSFADVADLVECSAAGEFLCFRSLSGPPLEENTYHRTSRASQSSSPSVDEDSFVFVTLDRPTTECTDAVSWDRPVYYSYCINV